MKGILVIGLMFIYLSVFSQNFFLAGNEYLNNGEFYKADSLYSLSVCNFETHNAYFNRAIARLNFRDTCSACEDFALMGKKYLDKGAMSVFHDLCCYKVDTVFFDRKFTLSNKSNYKYYEIVRWEKYSKEIYGTLHNKKTTTSLMSLEFSCNRLGGFNDIKSDMIAIFKVENNQKVYYNLYGYEPTPKSVPKLDIIKDRAKILLNNKYPKIKGENKLDEITIRISFLINEDGSLSEAEMIDIMPETDLGTSYDEFKTDVIQIINRYPNYNPGKVKGKPIIYRYNSVIVF